MPLFFQRAIDETTKLAVWRIAEEEPFFLRYVPLHRQITHPHKRLQHLAGRYLLRFLFPDFPLELIQIADTRKPYLEGEAYHFSISHCGDYAAAIVSKEKRVGVDIEIFTEKIKKMQHKFVSDGEMERVNSQWSMVNGFNEASLMLIRQLTLAWSCKEAVFKWYGSGELDFKEHMELQKIKPLSANSYEVEMGFRKNKPCLLYLRSFFFEGLVLSYVVT